MSAPVRNSLDHQIMVACQRLERVSAAGWVSVIQVRDVLPEDPPRDDLTRALRRLARARAIEFWRTSWPPTGVRQAIRLR